MVRWVEFSPFVDGVGRRSIVVKAFEANVQVGEGRGDIVGEHGTDGGVGVCFWFGVGAVPFSEVWESRGYGLKVGVLADDIPGTFEDQGGYVGESGHCTGWMSWGV